MVMDRLNVIRRSFLLALLALALLLVLYSCGGDVDYLRGGPPHVEMVR